MKSTRGPARPYLYESGICKEPQLCRPSLKCEEVRFRGLTFARKPAASFILTHTREGLKSLLQKNVHPPLPPGELHQNLVGQLWCKKPGPFSSRQIKGPVLARATSFSFPSFPLRGQTLTVKPVPWDRRKDAGPVSKPPLVYRPCWQARPDHVNFDFMSQSFFMFFSLRPFSRLSPGSKKTSSVRGLGSSYLQSS